MYNWCLRILTKVLTRRHRSLSQIEMSQRPSSQRLRVLCLHSFRTSAASFKKQLFELSNIGEALADLIELDLIDAPHECTPEEEERIEPGVKVIFGGPFYEWINAMPYTDDPALRVYHHIDASLDAIAMHMRLFGPYDGIMGFSQGGTMCHAIAMLAHAGLLPFAPPRFLIIFSGRLSRHYAHAPLVAACEANPLPVPSVVMWNGDDDHVYPEETERLSKTLKDCVAIKMDHVRGHKVPRVTNEANALPRLRAFLEAIPPAPRDLCTSIKLAAVLCMRPPAEKEWSPYVEEIQRKGVIEF